MVEQPVEDGGGQGRIVVEDLGPVLEYAIGGDRDRGAFVALADDLEQQVGPGLVDGEIAEFVEDQQPGSDIASEVAFELTGALGGGESVDGVDGAGRYARSYRILVCASSRLAVVVSRRMVAPYAGVSGVVIP